MIELQDSFIIYENDTYMLILWQQCRINHVADVANATGLRPQGGLRKSRKFFSARQYTSNLT